MHGSFNRFGALGAGLAPGGAQPLSITDLLPAIGTATGNLLVSSKSAVQRAAEYEADLNAAVARGAPIGTILSLKQKLAAAQYEVAQQKSWDAQQQDVLGGVRALQVTGVVVGVMLAGLLLKKIVE